MFFKQPIPMVIMRAGKILVSTSLVSRFSSMVVDYKILDCVGRDDFIFPISWHANRQMEVESAMAEIGCFNFLWKSVTQRRELDDIGQRAFKNIAADLKKHFAQITETFTPSCNAGILGLEKNGFIYEASVPTFTSEAGGPNDGPFDNVTSNRDMHYLPTSGESEWAYSSDPYNQALLRAALLSTTTIDELTTLLIKSGMNKNPAWMKFSEFIEYVNLNKTTSKKLREIYRKVNNVYYEERGLIIENDKIDAEIAANREAKKTATKKEKSK